MATEVRIRRGTTAQHAAFVGAIGEITVDTDKDTVVVHDGVTAGGFPLGQETVLSGKANAGANSDITSLSGLTTPLSIAQGGTAAITAVAARTSLESAKSGVNNDITSLSAVASVNGGAIGGFHNLIVNGNFKINQHSYVSGTATTAANQYTLDMWRVVVSGQSLTFTTLGNGRQVTAPAGGMEQVIDGASIGYTAYTINWAGTATCTVDGVAKTKGASVTLVPGTNATVRFTSGTVSTVQLEHGAVASAFEYLQPAIDLSRCQYYFRRIARTSAGLFGPVGQIQTTTSTVFSFPFSMRATPTPTYSSVSVNDTSVLAPITGLAAEATAEGHVFLTVTAGGGGLGVARAAVLYTAASGYIDLSAEPT